MEMKKIILILFIFLISLSSVFALNPFKTPLAIINPSNYNGNMENWCINPSGISDWDFGYLNDGTIKCDDGNSVGINGLYDGTHNMNEIPLLWEQHYGCCLKRSTDVYSGLYSVQIHKESKDDWYGFGQGQKFAIPIIGGKIYTINVFYKLSVSTQENRFEFNMKFVDINGVDIETATQTKNFDITSSWQSLFVTTTAPFNAKKMYWEIWIAQDAVGDLLIDDLTVDETGCIPGVTLNCGSNIGNCKYGTMTCQNNEVWGQCIGATTPTKELCGDNLDTDCDGRVDEGCTFTAYTAQGYIAKFNEINDRTHDGYAYSDSTSPTWWAWDNAPIVEAWENMYLATKDTKYLDKVVVNTDRLISYAGDGNSDGLKDWENLESPIDPILTYSRTLLPMVKFAYIIKKNNLQQYYAKADSYIKFVETNFIPVYDSIWKECGDMGFWIEGDSGSAPNNRASFVGRTHLYLWLVTGKDKYYQQSVKYANKIKSTLRIRTDNPTSTPYYFWNYANKAGCTSVDNNGQWSYICSSVCSTETRNDCVVNQDAWTCNGALEVGYSNYDLSLMLDYYETEIVFNDNDLTLLKNTFKQGLLVKTTEVDGEPTPTLRWKAVYEEPSNGLGYYSLTAEGHHWARLGQYDTKIKDVFDRINKWILDDAQIDGTYYNYAYENVVDTRDLSLIYYKTPQDESYRSTPAYQLSRIGWQLTSSQKLTSLFQTSFCGNSLIEGSEVCDNNNLDSKTCQDLSFDSGLLSCSNDCKTFDTTNCVKEQQCILYYEYTSWSDCSIPNSSFSLAAIYMPGFQTRYKYDKNKCISSIPIPESRECQVTIDIPDDEPPIQQDNNKLYIAGFILVLVIIIVFLMFKVIGRKKRRK